MKFPIAAGVAVVLSYAAMTVSSAMSLDGAYKPVFIYGGPKDDSGWNQAADQARTEVESALTISIPYIEPGVDEDIRTLTENSINQGHNIVIGDAARYLPIFKDLAVKYAHVAFINLSDDIVYAPRMPNLASVYGRSYESQYLCGVIAGMTSKSTNIGFLAPHLSPTVNWEINGYATGVRRAKPDATVHVVFIGDASSDQQRAAASALIDQGADVIGQSVDGPAPQIVAQERGVYATGHGIDLHELAPKSALCASVWMWARYLSPEIRKIAAGDWQADPDSQILGITRGGVDIACCSEKIAHQTMARLLDERDGIIINRKQVFAGPIMDKDGTERVPAGSALSDASLREMDWYVKGVVIDK